MKVTAKVFAAKTGFPLKLIRRMCRTGQLEHWQIGRVYWLDEQKAASTMELYKAIPIYTPKNHERCRNVKRLPGKFASRTERLKALIKNKNAASVAAPAAK